MMKRLVVWLIPLAVVFVIVLGPGHNAVQAQGQPGAGFASIPGTKGGQDTFGPYDIVKGWPKDLSTVPGNEKWTYGSAESVYAESPNRVFALYRGELPVMRRPRTQQLPEMGPSLQFPIGRLPWRDATVASPPGGGAGGTPAPPDLTTGWNGKLGVDANWENCIVVADANGNIIERWTQWDKILQRPHFVAINPYDPDKHVWIVDDHMQSIYKFTHDGKQLVQTIGTPRKSPAPMARTSTVRRIWPGFPTAPCSWPMATTERAWRNSTRTASSCSTGVRRARLQRSAPATSTTSTASPSTRRRGACS